MKRIREFFAHLLHPAPVAWTPVVHVESAWSDDGAHWMDI
jgi:hypothetical protein